MKRLAFCWVLLATPLFLYAQQHALCVQSTPVSFDSAAKVVLQQMIAADPYDTSEGGEVNAFRRWTEFYKNRVAYDAPQDSSTIARLVRVFEPGGLIAASKGLLGGVSVSRSGGIAAL